MISVVFLTVVIWYLLFYSYSISADTWDLITILHKIGWSSINHFKVSNTGGRGQNLDVDDNIVQSHFKIYIDKRTFFTRIIINTVGNRTTGKLLLLHWKCLDCILWLFSTFSIIFHLIITIISYSDWLSIFSCSQITDLCPFCNYFDTYAVYNITFILILLFLLIINFVWHYFLYI